MAACVQESDAWETESPTFRSAHGGGFHQNTLAVPNPTDHQAHSASGSCSAVNRQTS